MCYEYKIFLGHFCVFLYSVHITSLFGRLDHWDSNSFSPLRLSLALVWLCWWGTLTETTTNILALTNWPLDALGTILTPLSSSDLSCWDLNKEVCITSSYQLKFSLHCEDQNNNKAIYITIYNANLYKKKI